MKLKKVKYQILKTKDEIIELVSVLQRQDKFCFDLETTSLKTHSADIRIVGIGFCFKASESYYIPFNDPNIDLSREEILELVRVPLEDSSIPKIGQNLKYDIRVMHRFGVQVSNILMDTMSASYCLFSDKFGHALDEMCLNHFGHVKIRTKSVLPKKSKKTGTMEDSPIEQVGIYCAEDVDWTYRLYEYYTFLFSLPEYVYAKKIFDEYEKPLTPILIKMECNGVAIDTKVLLELKEEIIGKINTLKNEINIIAGREITITNPTQIAELVYDQLKLFEKNKLKPKKTKTGKLATNEKTLALIKNEPVIASILQVKKLNKLISTYIEPIPKNISDHTGFLHTSFNQTVTSTFRLSSSNPTNLQNIPHRTIEGKIIRKAFVSRFINGKIGSYDYSQQELRIMAHFSGEPTLIEAYKNDEDAHRNTASIIFKIPRDQVSDSQRYKVKTITYGLIYGMEAMKLSQELGITLEEAQELTELYMKNMTHVAAYLKESKDFLKKNGYVETMAGWRRYIPKIYSPIRYIREAALREGGNAPVQGTAAGQVKLAMHEVDRFLKDYKSLIIMQVHDEIVPDHHPEEFDLKDRIIEIMENVVTLKVPMKAEGKLALNWADAH